MQTPQAGTTHSKAELQGGSPHGLTPWAAVPLACCYITCTLQAQTYKVLSFCPNCGRAVGFSLGPS